MTVGELHAALAEAAEGTAPEGARTVAELVAELELPEKRVRAALRALHAEGRLRVHRVKRARLDGQRATVPAYTIVPAPRSSSRARPRARRR